MKKKSQTRASGRARRVRFALAIHGGAGVIRRSEMSREREREYRAALRLALLAGHEILAHGGSSLDAVVAAVSAMEDSPLFNAGRGAVFTADGVNELDASVMDGATLKAGGVALVTTVRNPVKLARLVMEETPHVLLAGHGAEALARAHGLETVAPAYYFTKWRWEALKQARKAATPRRHARVAESEKHGTVGAVALDAKGNLAAATSTGGQTNKMGGRVGDTPIVGAGTYANNATAAVSGTGLGEFFMRGVAAYTVSALMEFRGLSLEAAADRVIQRHLKAIGGRGGMIALDRRGNIAMPFSTAGMYRGSIREDGEPAVQIYRERPR